MAAGILVLILVESRSGQGKDVLGLLPEILARASAGIGAGILLYLAAGSGNPWLCIPVLAGMAALAALWKKFEKNVAEKRKTAQYSRDLALWWRYLRWPFGRPPSLPSPSGWR